MWEYFVVDQRGKFSSSKSKPNMTVWSSINKGSFRRIDWFQELNWISFILEIDEIFVILEDFHVSKFSPSSLNFLSCNLFLWFLRNLLFLLSIISIRPLNLDRSNMIHWEYVIFIQSSCQTHFKSCLNFCSTKV